MTGRRLLPLSGIAFVVLGIGGPVAIGGSTPGSSDSAAKVLAFYHAHSTRQGIAAFVLAASALFLVVFGANLAVRLWPSDAARRLLWEIVLIVGTALSAASILLTAMVHFALSDAGDNSISGQGMQALNAIDNSFWVAVNPSLGVMLVGAAGSILCASWAHRWLGWTAAVLGIALFIPFVDFFALLLSFIWIIATSILLSRERGDATAVPVQ
jgi:hypothetical protein